MSISSRFVKLLQERIDPESYNQISIVATQRVKKLNECIVDVAKSSLDAKIFETLMREAEQREADSREQIAKVEQAQDTEMRTPPVKPDAIVAVIDKELSVAPPKLSHAQMRLEERFSLQVSRDDMDEFVRMIKANDAAVKHVGQTMEIRTKYEIIWHGKRVSVIYSPKSNRVITAIPIHDPSAKGRKHQSIDGRERQTTRGNPRSARVSVDDDQ